MTKGTLAYGLAWMAVALIVTSTRCRGSGGAALAHEQVKALCELSEELSDYPAFFAHNIREQLSHQQNLLQDELKLRIYAAQQTGRKAKLAAPLLATYTAKCANKAPTVLETLKPGAEAVAAAAYLAGTIGEALGYLADIHQSGSSGANAGCLTASTAANVITGRTKLPKCGTPAPQAAQPRSRPSKTIDNKGFPNLDGTTTTTQKAAGTAKCIPLSSHQTTHSILEDQTVTANAKMIGGYIDLGSNTQTYTMTDIRDLSAPGTKMKVPAFAAAFDKHNAYKPATTGPCTLDSLVLSDVIGSTEAKKLYRTLLLNKTEKYNPEAEETELSRLITTAYGDAEGFKTTWIERIVKNKVPKEAAGEEGSGKIELENEDDIDKLRRILNYYSAQAIKRELMAAATGTGSNPACTSEAKPSKKAPTKEDCKEHTEQVPCEAKGCKFDNTKKEGEKCFPDHETKEAANQEGKGSKTTNTTTSNSFVIHKAPLLLAFLLF
uniref:Variant surface glycoprotein 527 n=1 Tax=Trypanosoma brucei TaxID=5691 RepID=M4TDF3_9TRYP|nr:variant surface glycoprotein 527 [Trypanosoma brucei]